MTRPKDIPEDVWEIARELLGEPDTVTRPKNIERAARALLSYGQRRADEARESAAQACKDVAQMASDKAANANEPTLTVAFQQVAIIIGHCRSHQEPEMTLANDLEDAWITVAKLPPERRTDTLGSLPPRLWEKLRIALQAEYRQATGEPNATLTVTDAASDARIAELEAEVERLRAQSETMRNILQEADMRIVWEHHGLGSDFTDRVEAVIFDESLHHD